jgi:1,4-dihydroxy-6-naphthoate synthase
MKLTLGFSPCPNDTFIFDALVNKKIDTGEFEFDVILEDVETLNEWAIQGKLDITKLSFPAFFRTAEDYILLNSGSALGKAVGPLLITKKPADVVIDEQTILLPGTNTTANLLFSFAFPTAHKKKFIRFDKIEDELVNDENLIGVIIHENRFTYQQKGLHKIIDLGDHWETKMNVPIPLGAIAIKRTISKDISTRVGQLIHDSLSFAFSNYPIVTDYVKQHSQSMSENVMRQHIDLYVNNFSLDLGQEGKSAIETLYDVFLSSNGDARKFSGDLFL